MKCVITPLRKKKEMLIRRSFKYTLYNFQIKFLVIYTFKYTQLYLS